MDIGFTARAILFYFYQRSLQGKSIGVTELADILETSKANITQINRTLTEAGYIEYQPYKPIALTNSGLQRAEKIYHRILLIESYLFKTLAMPFYQCRSEAFSWETAIFESTLNTINRKIDIKTGLTGDIIPSKENLLKPTKSLKAADIGNIVTVLSFRDLDSIDSVFLDELSFIYLNTIVLKAKVSDTIAVFCNERKIILPYDVASKIVVEHR
ncbi:MAG TPA: iron dependent repressor, metal binding and dimerization domain protein [Salinivirgaceae bacterium]|nr:iron dependent repressor, metal binding and dimerization domain protein [Salinivirgaceae bacterium]